MTETINEDLLNICHAKNKQSDLEAHLKLAYESNRKNSFKSWVFTEEKKCSVSKLAEAGFYFIGSSKEDDAVQCFLCDKQLDGWEENDDPWIEHKKHSPQCKFVQLYKPERKLTVYEFIDIQVETTAMWVQKLYEVRKSELLNEQKILRKSILDLKSKTSQK